MVEIKNKQIFTSVPSICLGQGQLRQIFIQYVLCFAREAAIANEFSKAGTEMVRL
jgi:hypothetical protein